MGMESVHNTTGTNEVENYDFTDSELIYYVRNALDSTTSDDSSYQELVGLMHHKERLSPDQVALLSTCLKALSGAVSCIDMTCHKDLLSSIFAMSLWRHGVEASDALADLVVSLAVSNGKFVDLCLAMLVRNFMPPYSFMDSLKEPRGLARKAHALSLVHSSLESISRLVPLAPTRLAALVVQEMPRIQEKEKIGQAGALTNIRIFVENMFRLESGPVGALVGSTMLMAVVDRLLDLDLDISWDDILKDESSRGIFEMELEDWEYEGEDADDLEQIIGQSLSRKALSRNASAEQLDALLVLTFEHLESCQTQGRLNEVFSVLLQSFCRTVLNAYKSKFTQFVMFYVCALDPENCGVSFSKTLVDLFCSDCPPLTRMSAAAYLASYLSRAMFLSDKVVLTNLKRLVDWCVEYCGIHGDDCDLNPEAHRIFYAGCQAIMYILCFRMRGIITVPWLKSQLSMMPIETILKHPLAPLKVCLPSVVEEFLGQAKAARLFTVSKTFIFDDLLESELSRAFGGLERLDMFFPFDPCLLKQSDSFIRQHYIYWSMVGKHYANDEQGSSDEEEDEEITVKGNDNMAMSYDDEGVNLDDFDLAMTKMSITPKNHSLIYGYGGELQELSRMPSKIRPSMSPPEL
ncbi:hypothetical protein MLD38_031102 [Melastoma candidum]|uniref:Uncharacterized protein n=1 Tax=Melastoma candidum TaxID=119954 RepID=A0ACB9MPV4_9MYRT|nr:hypothetical protein MLD38_031102 [Melastoma candidum]